MVLLLVTSCQAFDVVRAPWSKKGYKVRPSVSCFLWRCEGFVTLKKINIFICLSFSPAVFITMEQFMQIRQGRRSASSSDIPFCKFQIKPLENEKLPSLCTLVSPGWTIIKAVVRRSENKLKPHKESFPLQEFRVGGGFSLHVKAAWVVKLVDVGVGVGVQGKINFQAGRMAQARTHAHTVSHL